MNSRSALLLVSLSALGALGPPPVFADAPAIPSWASPAPGTPLDAVPVYRLPADDPHAVRALEKEIERLYKYATTLPSGPDRRALQTRIHLFEKLLRPLWKKFDASAWDALRADLRAEWVSILAASKETAPPAAP